jgi:hypothetical protein
MINPELQDAARGGVLRIDEASFLSARAGRWLLEFARDSGTRLVVPGDVRQHHSVERGDWLRVMEQTGAICYAAITKIFRQQIAPLRDAVRDLSQGKIEEGLDKLEKFGAICQVEDKTERLAKIAELHLAALKERKSSLIVAPTHGECRTICGAVREAMKGEGMLSGPEQTVPRLKLPQRRSRAFRRSIVRSFMSRCPELARPCIFSLIARRRYERRRAGRVNGFRRSRSGARTK